MMMSFLPAAEQQQSKARMPSPLNSGPLDPGSTRNTHRSYLEARCGALSRLIRLVVELREEVVALVIHNDERWEIHYIDFPDGLHPKLRIF